MKTIRAIGCLALSAVALAAASRADLPSTAPAYTPAQTLVTLHVKDAAISDVVAELSRQSRQLIVFGPPPGGVGAMPKPAPGLKPITLDVESMPFWTVMKQCCDLAGYVPTPVRWGLGRVPIQGPDTILLVPVYGAHTPPVFVDSNGFLLMADLQSELSGFGRSDSFRLHMLVDPKVHILGVLRFHVDEVSDSAGHNFRLPDADESTFPPNNNWYIDLRVVHAPLPAGTTHIAHLRATAKLRVVDKGDDWEVAKPLTTLPAAHANALGKFSIDKLIRHVNSCTLETTVEFAPGTKFNSAEWGTGGVRLFDAAGHVLRSRYMETYNFKEKENGGSSAQLVFSFPQTAPEPAGRGRATGGSARDGLVYVSQGGSGPSGGGSTPVQSPIIFGEPVSLVWKIPLSTREITVPIAMDNIPLPAVSPK